jgi:hypothetical protein
MAKQKGMSLVEKAGLFFGVVGVLADFTALVSFTYGFASLDQFTPSHISPDSATSFFKWFSGLIIIYAWLITSWYFVRRSFVLRYEKPHGYKNPLDSRSTRTIFGIALFLFPAFVYWSIVNVSISVSPSSFSSTNNQIATATSLPNPTFFPTITETPTGLSDISLTETLPPISENITTVTITSKPDGIEPTTTNTPIPSIPLRTISPEENARQMSVFLTILYYIFGLPLIMLIFGLVIYACLNSLMPIVHVELLDDYE